jgi:hypothetical protein
MTEQTKIPIKQIHVEAQQVEPSQTTKAQCPACTYAKGTGAKFCPQCGNSLLQVSTTSEPPQPETMEAEPIIQIPVVTKPQIVPVNSVEEETVHDLPIQNAPAQCESQPLPPTCSCGQVVTENADYCMACGHKISEDTRDENEYLLVIRSPSGEHSVPWDGGELTVGKADDCGLVIIDDEYLSRRQVRLALTDGDVFIEDMGSSNGTFLKIHRPVPLEIGDEILIGTCLLRLEKQEFQTS